MHELCDVPPVVARKLPAAPRRFAAAPCSQYDPAGHVMHCVEPEVPWYVPAVHMVQAPALAAEKVPLAHGVAAVEPAEQKEPWGQLEHAL